MHQMIAKFNSSYLVIKELLREKKLPLELLPYLEVDQSDDAIHFEIFKGNIKSKIRILKTIAASDSSLTMLLMKSYNIFFIRTMVQHRHF